MQAHSSSSASSNVSQEAQHRVQRHGRETVEFSVKGPIGLSINDELTNSGCAVLDLLFSVPSEVGELTFRNYYTMWITILVKARVDGGGEKEVAGLGPVSTDHGKDDVSEWMMSIPRKVFMPYPHHENGSHDLISVCCSESCVEWKNLVAMRIVLRQPSPVWKTFHIEEINIYKDMPRRTANKEFSVESIPLIMRRQTIAALKWSAAADPGILGFGGPYEFAGLPQP